MDVVAIYWENDNSSTEDEGKMWLRAQAASFCAHPSMLIDVLNFRSLRVRSILYSYICARNESLAESILHSYSLAVEVVFYGLSVTVPNQARRPLATGTCRSVRIGNGLLVQDALLLLTALLRQDSF